MKVNRPNKPRKRRGAAMVEFAIVAPILFLFFFAAFEFCRANMIRHTADNAVYEGARMGILPGSTAAEAQQEARRLLNTLGLQNFDVQVTPSVLQDDTEQITVRAEVPLDGNSFLPTQYFTGRVIAREITMTREGVRRD